MDRKKMLQMLEKVKALITNDHFVYTSGKHGSAYINKDAIYPYTEEISKLCLIIAKRFADENIEIVIAPAVGGIILSQWTAYHLSKITGQDILSAYAEKEENNFIIKRGYDKLITNKRVLVVEDILTTGGSVKKVIEAVRLIRGNVVGVGALFNRGSVTPDLIAKPPKLFAIINLNLITWEEKDCPLCKKQIPINTSVGKGREYLLNKKRTYN